MIQGYTAPSADEVVVKRSRLAELERKARGHDIYMAAMRRMRAEGAAYIHALPEGWYRCLNRFAELIAEEDSNAE